MTGLIIAGYVPGRYVEPDFVPAPTSKRVCRWCDAPMPSFARNSGCSAACSEALSHAKREKKAQR
jgi:predicted nucleic acid-binding Zn ribbon protein